MGPSYSLTHLSDQTLLRDLAAVLCRERTAAAVVLAHLAEVDARKLYLPAGYPSMYLYCVQELRLAEQAAFKRIRAARTARQFPAIFAALADGRLHLGAVVLLTPFLVPETADELLAAATHKTCSEIEQLLAQRFPRADVPARVEAITPPASPSASQNELSMWTVEGSAAPADGRAPGRVEAPIPRPKVAPLAPGRFTLRLTMSQSTHDNLRYAQALLSHAVPSGDVAQVFDRALKALIGQLEKRKFAATERPQRGRRRSQPGGRHIPADVKRAVWERDGGRCTFVSEAGRRCPARTLLEFDHVDEVARGGQATVTGIRLRCRAHNQYGAEQTFGIAFMSRKRQEARRAAANGRAAAATKPRAQAKTRAQATGSEQAPDQDVISGLRWLGFRADEARRAAALCDAILDAPLEQRMRVALSYFAAAERIGRRRPEGTVASCPP